MQDNNDRNTALMEKTAGVNTQIESLQTSFDQWQQKQNDAREEFESFRQSFLQTENQANAQNKSFNELNIKHLHAQNQANQTRQNIEFYQSRQSEIVGKNTSNQTLIEQSEIEINNLQAQLGDKDTYIKNLYVQKDEFTKVLQQKEQHYFDEKGKIDALEQNLKQFQRKKEQHLAIISELKEQLNQLKIKMLSVNERLSVEFNIDLDSLPPIDYISAENIQKIGEYEETVQKLRRQIETFGEVNPFAIEAFNEMKKRHDFIIEQRNDLLQSKKSLLDTMQEIENTAVNLFMDAFNQVRDNFQKVFRKLFTEEDQCDLTLTNPDDPLESAVEIIAKPKGKKPSTIDQLSGGEKSLTAISLIFGLYLLKPAPFCILDEVDAPLDDVNVEKFSQMIREFSDNSQFIVITHNKNTMVSVDVVYGIVAQDGVSRAVPVDLHEIEYTNEKS
ncbi:MAG: hypothetical protein H6554_09700 [Chitinophagales bacterium]|nr:hypothetical protein [Chitinophagales bacterium]